MRATTPRAIAEPTPYLQAIRAILRAQWRHRSASTAKPRYPSSVAAGTPRHPPSGEGRWIRIGAGNWGAHMSLIDRGFAIAYRLARIARAGYWELRQPVLFGVRAIVVRGGHILLVRHRAGPHPWALPGGGVDRHERVIEAARREVYEEAGVIARGERVLGVYEVFHGRYPNYIVVYVMEARDTPRPPRSIEIADAQFVALDQLPPEIEPASARRIAEYCSGERGITALW